VSAAVVAAEVSAAVVATAVSAAVVAAEVSAAVVAATVSAVVVSVGGSEATEEPCPPLNLVRLEPLANSVLESTAFPRLARVFEVAREVGGGVSIVADDLHCFAL
jgi:hypothetical protein